MILGGRHTLSATWQTACLIAAMVAVGRWLAGGGFGYTLFAVVWGPVTATWVLPVGRQWRTGVAVLALVGVFALPWWVQRPGIISLRLTGWLTLFIGTAWAVRRLASGLSDPTSAGVASLIWMAVVIAPVLVAHVLASLTCERTAATVAALGPILLSNAADTTAGDWTHQRVAYATLTRLGQDIPFDWMGEGAAFIYSVAIAAGIVVPRGTTPESIDEKTR